MNTVRIVSYGSGSTGNAIVAHFGKTCVLLDAGLKTDDMLMSLYLKERPQVVIITHEHNDHIKNLEVLKTLGIKTYVTKELYQYLSEKKRTFFRLYPTKKLQWISIDETLKFRLHPSFHDTVDPVCIELKNEEKQLYYITDTFEIPMTMQDTPTHLIVEANHDLNLVDEENRQLYKRGFTNHLEINKTLDYLKRIRSERLEEVWLHHLSQRFGNRNDFLQRAEDILKAYPTKCFLA